MRVRTWSALGNGGLAAHSGCVTTGELSSSMVSDWCQRPRRLSRTEFASVAYAYMILLGLVGRVQKRKKRELDFRPAKHAAV
eukprot:SAG11_NODE_17899_length_506_cov_0.835381_1_plen_81_part_10